MAQRQFVIGDIHGCFRTFAKLLKERLRIEKDDCVYLLGDYIDRGTSSKEVVELIITLIEKGYNIFPIRGNHEQMLIDSLDSYSQLKNWQVNGAGATLASFRVQTPEMLQQRYIDFFESLPFYLLTDDFVIVHGSLNFSTSDPLTDYFSMLWSRPSVVDRSKIGGRRVICGHTPTTLDEISRSLTSDHIRLDGGCVYFRKFIGAGFLCALDLNTMELTAQVNSEY